MVEERGRVGSSFEDYLREQGTLEETTAAAVKRVIAWQLKGGDGYGTPEQERDGEEDAHEPQPAGPGLWTRTTIGYSSPR